MFDIVGACQPCMDLCMNVAVFPKPNGGATVRQISWQGGGKVATGLAAAGRLGAKCAMMGAVGDDIFGAFCLRDLERHGVDTGGFVVRAGQSTPLVNVLSDSETGGRCFIGCPGTADRLSFAESDKTYIHNTKYFFVTIMDAETEAMVRYARDTGAQVVIDADSYSEETMGKLSLINVFIASESVLAALGGDCGNAKEVARSIMQKGPKIVVFTLGANGCAGASKEGSFKLPAFDVDVVDTVGAGDVYHGAFIVGLLDGLSVAETARFASGASAIKCTRIGGRAGIPNRAVLKQFLADGTIDYTEIDERVAFYERGIERYMSTNRNIYT